MTEKQPTWKTVVPLIFFMTLMRVIPHPWNFTPILGGALYLGATLTTRQSLFSIFAVMLFSDILIGFYDGIAYVYLTLAFIAFFGRFLRKLSVSRVVISGVFSSILFFLTTNFSVWATGTLYSKNLNGLMACYYAGIPFFHSTLISTLLYSGLFFGAHAYLQRKNKYPLSTLIEKTWTQVEARS